MGLIVRPVESYRDLAAFIDLPWRLYGPSDPWVPPLRIEMKKRLDPRKHPFFEHGMAEYFVAWQAGRPVGRVAAIRNELHEWYHHEPVGFFGFFECIPDIAVARALMDSVLEWLRAWGLKFVRGPMNFSTNEECGLLVEGFDRPPAVLMPYNPPYYAEFLEALGFRKAKDLWAWEVDKTTIRMDEVVALSERIAQKWGPRLMVRTLQLRRLEEEADVLRSIYNDAWCRNWGFVPMLHREFVAIARDLKPIADPDLALVAEWDGRPVAFTIGIPDIYEVLRRIPNGRLLPFGWWTLLRGLRQIRSFRVITLGVRYDFRYRGIEILLYSELYRRGARKGYTHAEFSWILEDNDLMNRPLERIGARRTKVYRIYERPIGE